MGDVVDDVAGLFRTIINNNQHRTSSIAWKTFHLDRRWIFPRFHLLLRGNKSLSRNPLYCQLNLAITAFLLHFFTSRCEVWNALRHALAKYFMNNILIKSVLIPRRQELNSDHKKCILLLQSKKKIQPNKKRHKSS